MPIDGRWHTRQAHSLGHNVTDLVTYHPRAWSREFDEDFRRVELIDPVPLVQDLGDDDDVRLVVLQRRQLGRRAAVYEVGLDEVATEGVAISKKFVPGFECVDDIDAVQILRGSSVVD